MNGLLWPGDHRAGQVFAPAALVAAMTAVESAWLDALVTVGIAPAAAATDLAEVSPEPLAVAAEDGGNPVIPLLSALRDRASEATATWLHRGLTSQDVMDTALMLCARTALDLVAAELDRQVAALVRLTTAHRNTPMVGRTLTQHAVPITFGAKTAGWLHGVLDAAADVRDARERLPAQFGGAAGTRSAARMLARAAGFAAPDGTVRALVAHAAGRLGLVDGPPWHTRRTPVTRLAAALTTCTDAWGHVAGDVLLLGRPEIAEVGEPAVAGRGGSSAMPHKANPVLSVLIRRAALAAPQQLATLHLAAALAVDERPDGAWHAEWEPLATLARHTVTAAAHTTELLTGLRVHPDRMRATLAAASETTAPETAAAVSASDRGAMAAAHLDDDTAAAAAVVDAALDRARNRA